MILSLPILYQDAHYVAINKPNGLLVHRSPIARDATQFALQLLSQQIGHYVYPIHRLDRKTSGVLIFGLTQEATALLKESFSTQTVIKPYQDIVRGFL